MFVRRLKLRPPQLLPTWIERPAVERRLEGGARVLSIVAGPGYGKTVLAARMFDGWAGPRLWYSLDSTDADLAVFAAHLQAMLAMLPGVRSLGEEFGRLASPREIGSVFAEPICESESPVLLVFDDVHVLEDSRALSVLGELVERATATGAAFILSGRAMPLPLHAVAASGLLASAGAADLAFDETESQAYLERAAPGRDAGALRRLAFRAEGWPAGLALVASTAALDEEDGPGEVVAAQDERTRRLLFDYLAAEVLAGLSERERGFLLETSILDELEIEVCDAVTGGGDAAELLPALARRGLFITRRSDDAYSAHQLFREFLRDALGRSRPAGEIAALHRRAAESRLRGGDNAGAIAHLLDAGDCDEAAAALELVALPMLASGLVGRVGTFLQRIGRERIELSPTLLAALGRLEQIRGDWDRSLITLERAILTATERGQHDVRAEAVRAASSILAARAEFSRLRELLEETLALEGLGEASRTALEMTLGATLLENNRLSEALELFGTLMPSVVARGDLALQGMVLHNTAVAHVRRGDPYAGLAMYERALKVKRSAGQRVSALMTLGNLIFAMLVVGDRDEAERLLPKYLADAHDIGNANMAAHAHGLDGTLRLLRGDATGALRALRDGQRACDSGDVLVLPEILHGIARVTLALGRLAESDDHCAKAVALLRGADRRGEIAPVLLTRAECAFASREPARALALAREALQYCRDGPDAVLEAGVSLEAAALLVRLVSELDGPDSAEAERAALGAATAAVALVHQRDYRFLLRTKAAAFAVLQSHMRRWQIGRGLLPEGGRPVPAMRVEMLGGLRVYAGGEAVPGDAWKRRKAREIFAYLASARGRGVPRERLIDLFWPETEADAAHANLRVTISAIRKAAGDVVKFEANGYRFAPPPHTTIDTEAFDEHLDAARQALARGAVGAARHGFMAASELYRGDFLDGIEDGGWQWRERERLRAAALEALRWLIGDATGDPSFRRLALDRLLEIAPFDLDAVRRRLELMVADRRSTDARRDYEEWKLRYRAAVGADPPDIWQEPHEVQPPDGSAVRELLHSTA